MENIVLDKITYKNGQVPSLNKDNLNAMQDNTETAINKLVLPITALEEATKQLQQNQNTENDKEQIYTLQIVQTISVN